MLKPARATSKRRASPVGPIIVFSEACARGGERSYFSPLRALRAAVLRRAVSRFQSHALRADLLFLHQARWRMLALGKNTERVTPCSSLSSALTLPSRGRPTSGFAGCRPPLMSNVRRPRRSRCTSSPVSNFARFCRAVPASDWPANCWRIRSLSRWRVLPSLCPVAERPGGRIQMTWVGRATAWQSLVYQSQFSVAGAHWRAPGTAIQGTQANRATRQGLCHRPSIEQTAVMKQRASRSSKLGHARGTPNPSIEGTSTSKLRLLAAAPHVKR